MPNTPQLAPQIADNDPDVVRVLLGLREPIYSLSDIIDKGPHGRTKVYEHIDAELLCTFVSGNRRFAYAIDYAKYLVALKRIGDAQGSRHHLSKPVNRPAHDPKRKLVA